MKIDVNGFNVRMISYNIQLRILDYLYDMYLDSVDHSSSHIANLAQSIGIPVPETALNAIRLARRGRISGTCLRGFQISIRGIDYLTSSFVDKKSSNRIDLSKVAHSLLLHLHCHPGPTAGATLRRNCTLRPRVFRAALAYLEGKRAIIYSHGQTRVRLSELGEAFMRSFETGETNKFNDYSGPKNKKEKSLLQLTTGAKGRKGAFGENMIDFVLLDMKWLRPLYVHESITVHGFDGVLLDLELPFVTIVESKYRRRTGGGLKSLLSKTRTKGKQMSKQWIIESAKEMRHEIPDVSEAILEKMQNDQVERMVLLFNTGVPWVSVRTFYEENFDEQGIED